MAKTAYKVLQGIDYANGKRAEVGETVSDLPKESVSWLLASGVIIEADKFVEIEEVVPVVEEPVSEPVVEEAIVEVAVLDEVALDATVLLEEESEDNDVL